MPQTIKIKKYKKNNTYDFFQYILNKKYFFLVSCTQKQDNFDFEFLTIAKLINCKKKLKGNQEIML